MAAHPRPVVRVRKKDINKERKANGMTVSLKMMMLMRGNKD